MKYELFSLGPLTIHSYGLMIAIGVAAARLLYLLTNLGSVVENPAMLFSLLITGEFAFLMLRGESRT